MDLSLIESLFLQVPELTEKESDDAKQAIASLDGNTALKRLIKVSKVASILDLIECVGRQDYAQAFAQYKHLEAWTQLEDSILSAKDRVAEIAQEQAEAEPKKEEYKPQPTIKY